MEKWKPINYKGTFYYDPREELQARARSSDNNNDDWVAIPVKLALAVAVLRECGASTILTEDEDGKFQTPIQIKCRKPEGHAHMHYNGYTHWEDK